MAGLVLYPDDLPTAVRCGAVSVSPLHLVSPPLSEPRRFELISLSTRNPPGLIRD